MRIGFTISFVCCILLWVACKNQTPAEQQAANAPAPVDAPEVPAEPVDTVLVSLPPVDFYKVTVAKPNMAIIDIRRPEEFKEGHINKAVNMPFNDPSLMDKISALGRQNDYAIYCTTGSQSLEVAQRMKNMGFKRIYHLKSGLMMWGEAAQALQIN